MDDLRPPGSSPAPHVMCREIESADFGELLLLLQKGFPEVVAGSTMRRALEGGLPVMRHRRDFRNTGTSL